MSEVFESNPDFFHTLSTDGQNVWIRKKDVSGIEAISGTLRSEAYLKLYVAGYHFSVKMTLEELEEALKD